MTDYKLDAVNQVLTIKGFVKEVGLRKIDYGLLYKKLDHHKVEFENILNWGNRLVKGYSIINFAELVFDVLDKATHPISKKSWERIASGVEDYLHKIENGHKPKEYQSMERKGEYENEPANSSLQSEKESLNDLAPGDLKRDHRISDLERTLRGCTSKHYEQKGGAGMFYKKRGEFVCELCRNPDTESPYDLKEDEDLLKTVANALKEGKVIDAQTARDYLLLKWRAEGVKDRLISKVFNYIHGIPEDKQNSEKPEGGPHPFHDLRLKEGGVFKNEYVPKRVIEITLNIWYKNTIALRLKNHIRDTSAVDGDTYSRVGEPLLDPVI